jgi:hypothetical protein
VASDIDAWRHRDTMHSVGKFLNCFRKLGLRGWQICGEPQDIAECDGRPEPFAQQLHYLIELILLIFVR